MGKQGGGGGSVYNQSANAFGQAGSLYGQAAGGYNPALGTAAAARGPAPIAAGINRYMNPYTTSVIRGAQGDVQRMVDQQQNENSARASSMGAFGGSRAGIVEALTNSEGQRNLGQIAANLRNTGFNTAAGLAGQDIQNTQGNRQFNAGLEQQMGVANMGAENEASRFGIQSMLEGAGGLAGLGRTGFDIGQGITGQQMQQGGLQQALVQQVMNLAGGQYGNFMQGPQNQLSLLLSSLGMNPLTAATTTTGTHTPGIYDYLSLAGQTGGSIYGGKGGS